MSQWPKPWAEIVEYPDQENGLARISTSMVDLGPIRIANDTVYINTDGGTEGENRDLWEPLDVYLP